VGKWIEKDIATRLLHYMMRCRLIPPNQFGSKPGKLTTDTALCLAHNICTVNNYNFYTSLITFDMTGYFNNVNHNRLLLMLHDKGILLSICRWVQSFVDVQETRIRVDSLTDRARAMQAGFPQGSPGAGVLANYYSATLLKMFT